MPIESKATTAETGPNGQSLLSASSTTNTDALSAVSRETHNFFADIEDLVKSATSLTGDDLARAKAKLLARVGEARESVERVGGAVVDHARTTARATDGYVHRQPWQAIGIGAALGLVFGLVLARRR